ncbi:MAG: hypothetical protein ACXVEF_23675 [Polyangiales bacterium]
MLSLVQALGRVIAAFNRTKLDPSTKHDARAACDEALSELRRSIESLAWLRESLRASLAPLDRPSLR